MLSEFKKFIMRGNVLDLAIGVIIGAAFGEFSDKTAQEIMETKEGQQINREIYSVDNGKFARDIRSENPEGGTQQNGIHGIAVSVQRRARIAAKNGVALIQIGDAIRIHCAAPVPCLNGAQYHRKTRKEENGAAPAILW